MKPHVLSLSERDRCELEDFGRRTTDKEEAMRALVVLHKGDGESFRQIAKVLHIRPMTAVAAVERYRRGGVEGLRTRRGGGRPPRKKVRMKEVLKDLVGKDPQVFGYLRATWSVRAIARHLRRELGIETSSVHVWRILKELGLSYKVPKTHVASPDKDYEKKAGRVKGYRKVASALLKKGSP